MKEIAVICVLYNCSTEIINRWARFSKIYEDCIFLDNSSKDYLTVGTEQLPNYIKFGGNKGIAYAQNAGIRRAKDLGYKYVIFFDQDSIFSQELIENLKLEYDEIKERHIKIGAIGPALMEINTGKLYKGSNSDIMEPKKVDTIISSGMLTEIEVLNKVGGMKEELFIDLVDHEWCWRAKDRGYKVYRSGKTLMNHQVGKKSIRLLGYPILISAAPRYYYQYRNALWLLKCAYAPQKWKQKVRIRKFVEFFIVPFRSDKPLLTWRYMIKGIMEGIKCKL